MCKGATPAPYMTPQERRVIRCCGVTTTHTASPSRRSCCCSCCGCWTGCCCRRTRCRCHCCSFKPQTAAAAAAAQKRSLVKNQRFLPLLNFSSNSFLASCGGGAAQAGAGGHTCSWTPHVVTPQGDRQRRTVSLQGRKQGQPLEGQLALLYVCCGGMCSICNSNTTSLSAMISAAVVPIGCCCPHPVSKLLSLLLGCCCCPHAPISLLLLLLLLLSLASWPTKAALSLHQSQSVRSPASASPCLRQSFCCCHQPPPLTPHP